MAPCTIGIIVNRTKPHADTVARRLVEAMLRHEANILLDASTAKAIGYPALATNIHEEAKKANLLFVLGGDGTLLGVAREFACFEIPILAVNIGHLGFLSEAEPDDLDWAVKRVVQGDYRLQRRMMLEASVWRDGVMVHKTIGLNDVGIGKGSLSRMIRVKVRVDDEVFDEFMGDGLIISTPTGSTAYSLSCGGPIVMPDLQVMVITPVCAHKLMVRPCVIGANQFVSVIVNANHQDFGITVDGQVGFSLRDGDEVRVSRASYDTILVRWQERSFFGILRNKLQGELGE